jgi:phage portal protein BeeE
MYNPFKNWHFQKKDPVAIEKKSAIIDIPSGSFLEHALLGAGYVSASQAMNFYQNTAAVATAVDMIADAIEQINPVLLFENGVYEDQHEILDFLKQPNGFENWGVFVGKVARYYLLKHDSILTAAGNIRRPPLEVWPVSLQSISILEGTDDYPNNYLVTSGVLKGNYLRQKIKNIIRFYDGNLKELFHIQGFSSRVTQTESDSPLQAAAQEAKQIIKGKTHNLQLLTNGGRLSLLIAFNDDDVIDDDEHKDRIKKINEQYGGSNNAGKIGVISNADISSITEFGTSNKDMDYSTLEKMAALSIYLRYKIPLALVTNEASTFNNLATGIELLYDNAVLPTMDTILAGLTSFLLPRYGIDSKVKLTYDPESIDPLKKRRLNEIEQRKKTGLETTNELRSLIPGRESIENGDTLYQPANLVPIGDDLFTEDND